MNIFVNSMRHFKDRPETDPEHHWTFDEYVAKTRSGTFSTLAEFLKGKLRRDGFFSRLKNEKARTPSSSLTLTLT